MSNVYHVKWIYNYLKKNIEIIGKENLNQEFRLKNIDETKNYFEEDICQIELMNLFINSFWPNS